MGQGGGVTPPPPAVYGHSDASLAPPPLPLLCEDQTFGERVVAAVSSRKAPFLTGGWALDRDRGWSGRDTRRAV